MERRERQGKDRAAEDGTGGQDSRVIVCRPSSAAAEHDRDPPSNAAKQESPI